MWLPPSSVCELRKQQIKAAGRTEPLISYNLASEVASQRLCYLLLPRRKLLGQAKPKEREHARRGVAGEHLHQAAAGSSTCGFSSGL